MKAISNAKVLKNKIAAFVIILCMIILFVPTVPAESGFSENTSSGEGGFQNIEQDGGTLFIGTARIPRSDSDSIAAVKYIYSDGIILNEKSFELIQSELNYFGIDIPENFTVSGSDTSNNNISTGENRQAIFACGSEENPTRLTPYQPYESVEKSFENLFKGYIFSISGYTSLKNILEGRDTITLSEDGKTAQTSIVMEEDYVEKVINGKNVTILMINSELKYSFSAPKMTFTRDENYIVSTSDITSPDTSSSNADVTAASTTASSPKITAGASPEITSAPQTTASSTVNETSSPSVESAATSSAATASTSTTISSSVKITADASPEFTSVQANCSCVTLTSSSSTESTTASNNTTSAASTTTSTSASITAGASSEITSALQTGSSATMTAPTSTESTTVSTNPVFSNTTKNILLSQRGIVNTRRLPLNIRSGPGTNYMVVTVLPKGTYVTVLDTTNSDWYMVKTMGKVVGYAYSQYIRLM